MKKKQTGPSLRLLPKGKKQRRKTEFLGGAAVAVFTVVIILSFGASGTFQYAMRSPQVAAVVSAVLVQLTNSDRAGSNLSELTVNPILVEAAQAKANDMAANGYFAHVSPTGVDPWHWFAQAGYKFEYAGENLAVDFSDSGDVNTAWMNSPTHRENILNPKYTEIGIATAQGMYQGRLTTFVVQEFGSPARTAKQAPIAAAVVPASPTKVAEARVQREKAQVLGTVATSHAVATTDPKLAASLAKSASEQKPLWAPLIGFPRETLRLVYYAVAALVLLALAFDTGFEWHERHRRRAKHAGMLLVAMGILFLLADMWFFAPPVLATASTVLSL